MSNTHTPGPLHVTSGHIGEDCDPPEPGKQWLAIEDEDGDELAVLVNRKGEPTARQHADATLFASAPEMLAALRECADYCATFFEEGREHRVVRAADAAIARAEGRTP